MLSSLRSKVCVFDKVGSVRKQKVGVSRKMVSEWKHKLCVSNKMTAQNNYKLSVGISNKVAGGCVRPYSPLAGVTEWGFQYVVHNGPSHPRSRNYQIL